MRIKRNTRSVIKKFESFSGDEQSIVYAIISAFDAEEPTRVDRNCPDGFYAYDVKIPQDAKENLKDMFARLDSILPDGYGASCALQSAKDITLKVFVMKGGIDGFLSDMGLKFDRWDEDVENPYSHNFGRIEEDSLIEEVKSRGRALGRMNNITQWSGVDIGSYDFDYSLVDFEVSKSEDTVDVYVQLYVDGDVTFYSDYVGGYATFFDLEEKLRRGVPDYFWEVEGEIKDIISEFLIEFKPGSKSALQALRNVGLVSYSLDVELDIKPVQPSML